MAFWRPFPGEADVLHVPLKFWFLNTLNLLARQGRGEQEFPDRKIEVVDSLQASSGYGLLVDGLPINAMKACLLTRQLHID